MRNKSTLVAIVAGSVSGLGLLVAPAAGQFQSMVVPGPANRSFGTAPSSANVLERLLTGDTVDTAVTAFNTGLGGGGAFLTGPASHAVGSSSIIPSAVIGLIPDHSISTSVGTVGSTRFLSITIGAAGGGALAPAGLSIGGAINALFFELPDINGGPDLFDDPEKIGAATGTFELLGTAGAVLFSAPAAITDLGTSFSIGNGVTIAAGADIFDPTIVGDIITGGSWSISYPVPAPSGVGVLALAGLVATRRRR